MKRLLFILVSTFHIFLCAQESVFIKDSSNFMNLMNVMLSENKEILYFKNNIDGLEMNEEKDIGFHAKRYKFKLFGENISNWITICTLDDKIFYCKTEIISGDVKEMETLANNNSDIAELYEQYWEKIFEDNNHENPKSVEYEYVNEELYQSFKKDVALELGELKEVYAGAKSLKYYNFLMLPFKKYDFGYDCYEAGTVPIGRQAVAYLMGKHPKLIKNIIRGYNPEGRIYGIEAILVLASKNKIELTKDDVETIKRVLSMSIYIDRCKGFDLSITKARKLFSEPDYKKIFKKNGIEL